MDVRVRAVFDFSTGRARPSTARIMAAWRRADRPLSFSVEYGEAFAEFDYYAAGACWEYSPRRGVAFDAEGNGQRGIDRQSLADALRSDSIGQAQLELQVVAADKLRAQGRCIHCGAILAFPHGVDEPCLMCGRAVLP